MGIIADVHFLRKHGVYKMVRLPVPRLTEQYPDANEYYFFTRPTFQLVDLIMEAIRCNLAHSSSLPFVPPTLLLLHLCPSSLPPFSSSISALPPSFPSFLLSYHSFHLRSSCPLHLCRTSSKKQGKAFIIVFVPQKSQPCVTRFQVSEHWQLCHFRDQYHSQVID